MSNIYLMLIDAVPDAIDWITYCRAHMLYEALPNCAGIYRSSDPPAPLKSAPEGWNLYVMCHGNADAIGGLAGSDLADLLHNIIPPNKLGFIHIQSCATGEKPASEFTTRLGQLGHKVIVKAPSASATFTDEIGFRVLDAGSYTPLLKSQYKALVGKYKKIGEDAVAAAGTGNLRNLCRSVYQATFIFWQKFSTLFKQCSMPTGSGWKAYETTSTGSKPIV